MARLQHRTGQRRRRSTGCGASSSGHGREGLAQHRDLRAAAGVERGRTAGTARGHDARRGRAGAGPLVGRRRRGPGEGRHVHRLRRRRRGPAPQHRRGHRPGLAGPGLAPGGRSGRLRPGIPSGVYRSSRWSRRACGSGSSRTAGGTGSPPMTSPRSCRSGRAWSASASSTAITASAPRSRTSRPCAGTAGCGCWSTRSRGPASYRGCRRPGRGPGVGARVQEPVLRLRDQLLLRLARAPGQPAGGRTGLEEHRGRPVHRQAARLQPPVRRQRAAVRAFRAEPGRHVRAGASLDLFTGIAS